MNEKLKDVADAVLNNPIKIEVDVLHPSLWDRLMKRKKRVFFMGGLTLGTLVKISKLLLDIDIKLSGTNLLESNYRLIENHAPTMAKIIAAAVHNQKGETPRELVSFFLHNLTSKELGGVTNIVLNQMDVISFMKSIVSVKGMNLLTSLKAEENIASGQPLEE